MESGDMGEQDPLLELVKATREDVRELRRDMQPRLRRVEWALVAVLAVAGVSGMGTMATLGVSALADVAAATDVMRALAGGD